MVKRVLVTGSAGRIGRAVVAELLVRGHMVVGYDLRPTPGLPDANNIVGSLLNADLLARAMAGVDSLVHLAAAPDDSHFPPADDNNFESELLPSNVLGSYRVMDAARRVGVRNIILASTGQVIDGHLDDRNTPITAGMPYRPRYLYACTKVFLEMLGRVYAEQHAMRVLAVRLGWCPRDAKQIAEIAADPESQDVYLSPGDAGRFFAAAVEADPAARPRWAVVYCTSLPRQQLLYDLEPAQKWLGWRPAEQWPTGAE
ncbi:MAG: NAD(P)-dependent oxidoreductase [Fimbriiglobus sp.]|nr:NAD(P)-dependent oxidoreductase [Fimbriiglobus sp.]